VDRAHRTRRFHFTVLWERGQIRCTALVAAFDHIEISVSHRGVVFHQQVFADSGVAATYALTQMQAYDPD
jgi:hypothetical protein